MTDTAALTSTPAETDLSSLLIFRLYKVGQKTGLFWDNFTTTHD